MGAHLGGLRKKRVVVLPDLFIDAIAHLPSWAEARPRWDTVVANGGGNLPVRPIEFKLGGNGANVALALARLGVHVDFITQTDALGAFLLERAAEGTPLHVSGVQRGPVASATLALEFGDANLMLSHAGPLRAFGPERLTAKDWKRVRAADAVVIVNWAQNQEGTRLLADVAAAAHGADAFVFLDTGDPRHRGPEATRRLVAHPRLWRHVDAWGLNENELRAFGGDGEQMQVAEALAARLGTTLDVHTRAFASSVGPDGTVTVPAMKTRPKRLTGAGDAWNAGNVAGYLLDWPPRDRLRLAHLVATRYVSGASGKPPTVEELGTGLPRPPAQRGRDRLR